MNNDRHWRVLDRTECIDDDEYIKSLEETCAWYHDRAEERERLLKEVRSQTLAYIFTAACACIFFCFAIVIHDYGELTFFDICQICAGALIFFAACGIIIAIIASAISFCFQLKVHQTRAFKIVIICIALLWVVLSIIGIISRFL